MDIDTLVRECRELAAAYVVASEAVGRANAHAGPDNAPPEIREAREAFDRLKRKRFALEDHGAAEEANSIFVAAVNAGSAASIQAQREELARLKVTA